MSKIFDKIEIFGQGTGSTTNSLTVNDSGGTTNFIIRDDGNIGVGIPFSPSITARLQTRSAGNTTGTIAFQAESNDTFKYFKVYGNGTLYSQGDTVNHLFSATAGSLSFNLDSPISVEFDFMVNSAIKSRLITQNGLTRFDLAANQFWGVYGSDNNPYILFDETNKNIGINIASPTAKLHVLGVDATSGNYSLKVDDSTSGRLIHTRNDGYTFFGPRYAAINSQNILSAGEMVITGEHLIALDTLDTTVTVKGYNKSLIFDIHHGIPSGNEMIIEGYGGSGYQSQWYTLDSGTSEIGFKTIIGASAISGDTNFSHRFINGKVNIGADAIADTKLQVKGDFSTIGTSVTGLSSNQNNYSTSGTSYLKINPTGGFNITGFDSGFDGKRLVVSNTSSGAGASTIVLKNEDTGSTATNRMNIYNYNVGGGLSDWSLGPGDVVEFIYDNDNQRWRKIN